MPDRNQNSLFQKNISFADFILESLKRWYVTVATVVVLAIATIIYTLAFVTPMYSSTAKVYIVNKQSEAITSSDFSISTYLSYDFAEIIVDTKILSLVSKEMEGKYTVGQLKSFVKVTKPENTRIIEVSAETPVPEDSKKIVDAICSISEKELVDIMGLDRVTLIKEGDVPSNPSSPNLMQNLVFSAIFAFLISEIVVAINFIFNNRITASGDIEKFLNLNVLATIPYNQSKSKK